MLELKHLIYKVPFRVNLVAGDERLFMTLLISNCKMTLQKLQTLQEGRSISFITAWLFNWLDHKAKNIP